MRNTVQVNHGVDYKSIREVFSNYDSNGKPNRVRTFSSMDLELEQLDKLQYREGIIIANRRMIHE